MGLFLVISVDFTTFKDLYTVPLSPHTLAIVPVYLSNIVEFIIRYSPTH